MIREVKHGIGKLHTSFGEIGGGGFDRMNKTLDKIDKKLDLLLDIPPGGMERKLDAMIEDSINRMLEEELGYKVETTAEEREELCLALRGLWEEWLSQ